MPPDARRWLFLVVGVVLGYVVLMLTHPARGSLRDGWRCLRRHPQLWLVPTLFGLAHAAFGLWVRVYESWVVPDAAPVLVPWNGWQAPPPGVVWTATRLTAVEGVASVFNCVVTAFPLSALWAALLLGNWRGYQGTLYRALRRRFGRGASLAVHGFFLLCAVAALIKPVLFGGLPRLNAYLGESTLLRAGESVNALSFFFEYLLGVAVQVYLIARVFAWARGLSFNFEGLRRFALRRCVFVFHWAAVVLAVGAAGINLPLVLGSFRPPDGAWEPAGFIRATRWFLAVLLVVFCPVQASLTFHNLPLRRALARSLRFWGHHGWFVGSFLVVAALHFLALAWAGAYLSPALGQWTYPAAAWNLLVSPLLWGGLTGWLLAGWVCLFRRCERGCPDADASVRF